MLFPHQSSENYLAYVPTKNQGLFRIEENPRNAAFGKSIVPFIMLEESLTRAVS